MRNRVGIVECIVKIKSMEHNRIKKKIKDFNSNKKNFSSHVKSNVQHLFVKLTKLVVNKQPTCHPDKN